MYRSGGKKMDNYIMETRAGNMRVGVKHGCFGMWVSVTPQTATPLTHHNIRRAVWVPSVQHLEQALGEIGEE